MAMGMTYAEFWDGPPEMAVAYRKAFKLKKQMDNELAWLQGIYNCHALAVCLSNAFSKQGSKKQTYFERPLDIFPLTEKEKKLREMEENKKIQKALEAMVRSQRKETNG